MRVFIWDNGERYSDHSIRFYAAPDGFTDEDICQIGGRWGCRGGSVVAVVTEADWRIEPDDVLNEVSHFTIFDGDGFEGWFLCMSPCAQAACLRKAIESLFAVPSNGNPKQAENIANAIALASQRLGDLEAAETKRR